MTQALRRRGIDLAAALEQVATPTAADLTLAELVVAYVARHPMSDLDLRLRKWLAAFGHVSAWSLKSDQVELAADAMREHGYAPATVNRDLSALGTVYKWARQQRLAPRGFASPTVAIRRAPEPIRRVDATEAEVQAIYAAALGSPNRYFRAFVHLLLDSGARKGEVLNRRWPEVDLEARQILAPVTKNGTPRILFFTERTAWLLAAIRPRGEAPSGYVFTGPRGAVSEYRRAWIAMIRDIGRPDLHVHDLRHIAAARLLKAGNTLGIAAQVLGHAPAMLARRYGHLETAALRAAAERSWSPA